MFDERPPTPWRDDPTPWPPTAVGATQDVPAALPPRSKRTQGRSGGLALVLIGALIGGAVGIGGARAITASVVPNSVPASSSIATATDTAAQTAIKDVLRKANQAQAAAFAAHDPSLMKATSTAAHYAEMVKVNAGLAAGGVAGIALVDITFGDIAVNGSTATAATTETWSSTYADGTTDQSTDPNEYDLVLESGSWKIAANTQPNAAPAGGGGVAPSSPQNPTGIVQSTSRNWSGYVATGATYTSVTGTWIIAKPDPKTPGVDATWVGIGGANTTDLVQAGTEATVNLDGTVTYDAWTETLPQATRTVTLGVTAGDTVSVTLTEQTAGSWLIEIKNITTGRSYTTTIRYSSSKTSAEWIEEAPSIGRGIAPLDSFGTVKFSAATTVADGKTVSLKGASAKSVTMTSSAGQALAIPSAIASDGTSFSVDRTSTPSTGGGTGGPGRRRG